MPVFADCPPMQKERDPLQGLIDHIRNPETRELPLPECAKREARKWVAERRAQLLEGPMVPPWIYAPDAPMSDFSWGMGAGEDFLEAFETRLHELSVLEYEEFRKANPEPVGWEGYYLMIRDN
ncbi:hypothetical protein ACMU_01010 [Actibacterium mucosum KCTC 23349]|uniref:Uncharacterized protein n=1 Tax=Actibacterium mucosum KCTC 23349 TaxID=1454373 RepID=A0A037ZKX6_9RHOB|nr:hypothetical protein [Actibacterium mucosum]KAJ57101.1 hypothetical protein ACMU_01010 [Actibacterium mucosum KCTC 23349]